MFHRFERPGNDPIYTGFQPIRGSEAANILPGRYSDSDHYPPSSRCSCNPAHGDTGTGGGCDAFADRDGPAGDGHPGVYVGSAHGGSPDTRASCGGSANRCAAHTFAN